jgi:hypothetical protein
VPVQVPVLFEKGQARDVKRKGERVADRSEEAWIVIHGPKNRYRIGGNANRSE